MKVAQLIATIPDALPPEFAEELAQLQSNAPPMGWPFVRRRMAAELGPEWRSRFAAFGEEAAAAASLGQVHRARLPDGTDVACKLQYPGMASAVEADLAQLDIAFSIYRRLDRALDVSEMKAEIGARLREELDYALEARHMALYRAMLADAPEVAVPETVDALCSPRLLTMTWLTGRGVLEFTKNRRTGATPSRGRCSRPGGVRSAATARSTATRISAITRCARIWASTCSISAASGVQPALRRRRDRALPCAEGRRPGGPGGGLRDLGLREPVGRARGRAEHLGAVHLRPLLDDRVRTIADGVKASEYGRREAFQVHQKLKELGPVKPPREFVFMDRAAIGLGAVFLHLGAELNFHDLFNAAIADFSEAALEARQRGAFEAAGVPLPE